MLEVRELRPAEIPAAAELIAAGMADNPIHVAAWPDPARRARALEITFTLGQRRPGRYALCVVDDGGAVVAVAGVSPEGSCRPSSVQASELTDQLSALGDDVVARYQQWRQAWRAYDPPQSHWHLGPFAVRKDLRSRGIGSQIMDAYCSALDRSAAVGYLEADRHENVGFYKRRGFVVTNRDRALDVPIWYMRREPATRIS